MGCSSSKGVSPLIIKESRKATVSAGSFVNIKRSRLPSEYSILSSLGSGGFGQVKLCRHIPTNQYRAVKIVHKAGLSSGHLDETNLLKEITALKELDHPSILRCFEMFEDPRRFYIVTEYCAGGELFDRILQKKFFSEKDAAVVMKQILSGVAYCHSRNIVHRDLKPENILLEHHESLSIKIADFGNSVIVESQEHLKGICGTVFYLAPEILEGGYNEKCDEWSCGVMMYVMLTGKPPYNGRNQEEILNMVKNNPLQISSLPGVSEHAVDLLKLLLKKNNTQRISAAEALEHPWFAQIDSLSNSENLVDALANIKNLQASNKLKEAIQVYIATHIISAEDSKAMRMSFQALDKNGDGTLTKNELIEIYKGHMSDAEAQETVDKVMRHVDSNQDGAIEYSEFLRAYADIEKYASKQSLESVFRIFDKDINGAISIEELKKILQGISNTDQEWQAIVQEIDRNQDGEIDLKELIELMVKEAVN